MAMNITKVIMIVVFLNIVTALVSGIIFDENENLEIMIQESGNLYYESTLMTDEEIANNVRTDSEQEEVSAGNLLIYSKSLWRTLLRGFKMPEVFDTDYDNPIEKAFAAVIGLLRVSLMGIIIPLILIALFKNKSQP